MSDSYNLAAAARSFFVDRALSGSFLLIDAPVEDLQNALSYQDMQGVIVDLRPVAFTDNDGVRWECRAGYRDETGYVFTERWNVRDAEVYLHLAGESRRVVRVNRSIRGYPEVVIESHPFANIQDPVNLGVSMGKLITILPYGDRKVEDLGKLVRIRGVGLVGDEPKLIGLVFSQPTEEGR